MTRIADLAPTTLTEQQAHLSAFSTHSNIGEFESGAARISSAFKINALLPMAFDCVGFCGGVLIPDAEPASNRQGQPNIVLRIRESIRWLTRFINGHHPR